MLLAACCLLLLLLGAHSLMDCLDTVIPNCFKEVESEEISTSSKMRTNGKGE